MLAAGKLRMRGARGIKFIGAGTVKSATAVSSVNVPTPAGAKDGDFLLMIGKGESANFYTPASFTYRVSSSDNSTFGYCLFHKMASGEPGSRGLSSYSAQKQAVALYAFRRADYHAYSLKGGNWVSSVVLPGVTAAKGLLLAVIFVWGGSPTADVTSWPAGFSKLHEYPNTDGSGKIFLFAKKVAAGATGDQTFNMSATSQCGGFLISIKKA